MHDSLNFDVFASINITLNQNWKRKTLSKTKKLLYVSKKHRHSGNLFPTNENRRFGSARPYRRGHFCLFYCIIHWFGTFKDAKTFIFMQESWIFENGNFKSIIKYAWFFEFWRFLLYKQCIWAYFIAQNAIENKNRAIREQKARRNRKLIQRKVRHWK